MVQDVLYIGSMKFIHNLDVDLHYQNFGSAWLGIMRGPTEQIELAFNSLFNYCATNGRLEYQDHTQTVATFWTSPTQMLRYFVNRWLIPRGLGSYLESNPKHFRTACWYANGFLNQLKVNHEVFQEHNIEDLHYYTCGVAKAEKPDVDMKDAILVHAFTDKEIDTE